MSIARSNPLAHLVAGIDDIDLSVSTALTYDRTGRCIEGSGIPVDGPATHHDQPAPR